MPFSLFCEDQLPDIRGFDDCNPNFVFGEIEQVLIGSLGAEPDFDVSDWQMWRENIVGENEDIDTEGDDFYAYLVPVRGTLTDPDRPEIDASKYRKAYPPAEWNIEFRVDDIPDAVYTALAALHGTSVRFWFISGGYIFGGANGLTVQMKTAPSIEEGRDAMHQFNCTAHYYGDIPARAQLTNIETDEA